MTPSAARDTGTIRLNLVDGTRQPISEDQNVLVRVLDGRKKQVATKWVKGPTIPILGLPYHDNADDWYTIIAHVDGYQDAGVYPVHLQAGRLVDAYLMLVPENGAFHFLPFKKLPRNDRVYQLISNGAPGAISKRYTETLEKQPQQLGALLTLGTAIRDIPLDDQTSPLQYYWEVIWDLLAPDRFWAWVDVRLADRIQALANLHSFAEEPDSGHWHPGIPGRIKPATRSWKQTRFDVTNVQLSFHEDDRETKVTPGGESVPCVIVEPDADYYKDVLSHGLLEVIPNLVTQGKTDPRHVYALRWCAARQEGLDEFQPPCTIE